MADPVEKFTHVADGLKRLLVQFQGQPNIEGVIKSYLTQVQELEVMFIDLMVDRYVDNAVGAQLDGIGRVVGEPRGGKDDTDYRVAIKARIRANGANSRVEDLHDLFRNLLPGFTFGFTSWTTAQFVYEIIEVLGVGDPSEAILDAQLQVAKGAGIRAHLMTGDNTIETSFTYADGDVLQVDSLLGYADLFGIGGFYRDVVS